MRKRRYHPLDAAFSGGSEPARDGYCASHGLPRAPRPRGLAPRATAKQDPRDDRRRRHAWGGPLTPAPLEIGAVARELGVAPSTLRSWERRYRLVVPRRGPNGQRLYDVEQVAVLRQILAQVHRGVRAGAAHVAANAPAQLGVAPRAPRARA